MNYLHERLEALEQHVENLTQQTHTVSRRLRWWRRLACGLVVLGLLSWGLPLGLAKDEDHDKGKGEKGLAQRVAALEKLLKHVSREGDDITITGANLHIVNGLGSTDCGEDEPIPDCPNGLGNLIVGYNELRADAPSCPAPDPICEDRRTGSHNVVVGRFHNFSRYGGLVVGNFNEISGVFASVSGGGGNMASGAASGVSGGVGDSATQLRAAVCGGFANTASGNGAAVCGGSFNTASGNDASVTGGEHNTASDDGASVSGGRVNTASGAHATVSGGLSRTAEGQFDWVAGSLVEDE